MHRADRAGHGDEGLALVAALMVTAIVTALALTVLASFLTTNVASGTDRQRSQAGAAAEAGLDNALTRISAASARGAEASLPCATTSAAGTPVPALTVRSSPDTATVTIRTLRYRTALDPVGHCPLVSGEVPTSLRVEATAVMSRGIASSPAVSRTMVQTSTFVSGAAATGPTLDRPVFSESGLSLTNSFTTTNGGAYTNGGYTCNGGGSVDGPVVAQGSVSLTNSCVVRGDVTSGGAFTCNASPTVKGNVLAAGTGTSSLTNSCTVGKSLSANGPIDMSSRPQILGDVTSTASGLNLQNNAGARINGNVRLGTTLTWYGGATLTSIGGTITQRSPSAAIAAPTRLAMPALAWNPPDWPGWAFTAWDTWVRSNATANGAPTWSSARTGSCPTLSPAYSSLNGPLTGPATNTVLDARTCGINLNGVQLVMRADLTIFAQSFYSTNGIAITSGDGRVHKLRIIVPSTAADVCTAPGRGGSNITFNAGGTSIDANTQLLLYAPGTVSLTNNISFYGSVYACTAAWSVATTINYADLSPPSSAGGGWTRYGMTSSRRFETK